MSIVKIINGQKKVIANNIVDHNQLNGRQEYGCHPISAIRKLPEKLSSLTLKDNELQEHINELQENINQVKEISVKQDTFNNIVNNIEKIEQKTKEITLVEENPDTLIFSDFNNKKTVFKSGKLVDNDTIYLDNDKISLKKIYVSEHADFLRGEGSKLNPLSLNIDGNSIIDNNGMLVSKALLDKDSYLDANKIHSLILDVDTKINKVNDKYANYIVDLYSRIDNVGGYLDAVNFGTSKPTQAQLTNYALENIGIKDKTQIFNQTRIKNLFNGDIWILTNTPNTEPAVFSWANLGAQNISDASNEGVHGLISGSYNQWEGSVNTLGKISINGLEEFASSTTKAIAELQQQIASIIANKQ